MGTVIAGFVALTGLAGLIFTIIQFLAVWAIEAKKPYLEKKLAWCEETVQTTVRITTSKKPSQTDIDRFWQMYSGVMCLIENKSIKGAMIDFDEGLKSLPSMEASTEDRKTHLLKLQKKSRALAYACRKELSVEWSTSCARTRSPVSDGAVSPPGSLEKSSGEGASLSK